MGKVIAQMSMSIDGIVAGEVGADWMPFHERLLGWVFDLRSWRESQGMDGGEDNEASRLFGNLLQGIGAYIVGPTMFSFGEEPWGDNPPYHAPVFIPTRTVREPAVKEGGTTFHFVNTGIADALDQAKQAAGDKGVAIFGGARTIQAYLNAGLVDELHLHVVPVIMGRGVSLFDQIGPDRIELEPVSTVHTPGVIHHSFRVLH